MTTIPDITQAVASLKNGGVIAYPTEAMFGLGCDPLNEFAVTRLLQIKQRDPSKGLILIAASMQQLQPWLAEIPAARLQLIQTTWPGPHTWVFPKSSLVPAWISGDFDTIAVRVTEHPIAKILCDTFASPIVSTSANIESYPPARSAAEVWQSFASRVDCIVPGKVGDLTAATTIKDALTDAVVRA